MVILMEIVLAGSVSGVLDISSVSILVAVVPGEEGLRDLGVASVASVVFDFEAELRAGVLLGVASSALADHLVGCVQVVGYRSLLAEWVVVGHHVHACLATEGRGGSEQGGQGEEFHLFLNYNNQTAQAS